eukprot:12898254-Prorocentrum_lima.AAC.1
MAKTGRTPTPPRPPGAQEAFTPSPMEADHDDVQIQSSQDVFCVSCQSDPKQPGRFCINC